MCSCNRRYCEICDNEAFLRGNAERSQYSNSRSEWPLSFSDSFRAANARAQAADAEYWSDLRHAARDSRRW